MKLRTVEITVGAFMIAGILSLVMLALQVSGFGHSFNQETGYKVQAEFTNIGGLKVRAKVSVAGVVIGRVVKIQLEPKTYNASVWLSIDSARVAGLPADSRASILTSGLLGDSYISLTPGFSDESLKDGDVITVGNTDSAIILEQLVSKFLANQVNSKSAVGH
jgi:phospholipid/cholesterol/gamma-HCH transport system substrate-binding protein